MRFAKLIVALTALWGTALSALATDLAVNDNPYDPIVARNIFGLLPIPTNPPVDPHAKPVTPPPKITPNGTMNLFGVPQALFKVAYPPAAGQPAHDQSYMLAEGESQDNIEVTKIDMSGGMITFNNNGTIQELALAAAPKITTPASPISNPGGGIGGGPAGGIPRPSFGGPRGIAGGTAPSGQASAGSDSAPSLAGSGDTGSRIYNPADDTQGLTPEAQALLIEKNYLDARQNPNSRIPAAMFPPTPLRGQSDASLNPDGSGQ